ncbi:hypothetical protein CUZ87_2783 [Enterococcus xinjiangensis]|nr:hypothetical protein [Enterococcus lactis]
MAVFLDLLIKGFNQVRRVNTLAYGQGEIIESEQVIVRKNRFNHFWIAGFPFFRKSTTCFQRHLFR